MTQQLAITRDKGGIVIELHVQPKASAERIVGVHAGGLKIAVTAPPEDGKANDAVVKLLASKLKIARSRISIIRGNTSRRKTVHIDGVEPGDIEKLIKK